MVEKLKLLELKEKTNYSGITSRYKEIKEIKDIKDNKDKES